MSLTGVERLLVIQSITEHLERMSLIDSDREILNRVLTKVGHEPLKSSDCYCLLRHMRIQRDIVFDTKLAVEERVRGTGDGRLNDVHKVLDSHLMLLDEIIRKLWTCVTG